MYTQYVTKHKTEHGEMRIERTYFTSQGETEVNSIFVDVQGRTFDLPKKLWQTDAVIVKKICAIVKYLDGEK